MTDSQLSDRMTLDQFKAMWEVDGFSFREEARKKTREATWILYGVTCPYGTSEYGRHFGLMVALAPRTQELIAHNIKNISNGSSAPWLQQVQQWWEQHVAEGLVYAD